MPLTVANLGLVSALVSLPLSGAWHADLVATPPQGETGTALSGTVSVDLDGLTLSGTVLRSSVVDGAVHARIVGGAGRLGAPLPERSYKGTPTVRRIVGDILREAATETLAAASSATILDQTLNVWHRVPETAGAALSRLVRAHGGSWRVLVDGTVLVVGTETWPTVAPEHTIVPGSDGAEGLVRVAWHEGTPTDVVPGVTFAGQRIRYVEHELSADGLRTTLRVEEPRSLLDRLRAVTSPEVQYSQLWGAVVEKQNGDGTVDLVVGTVGIAQVPIRHGIPGLRVLVSQGQRVLVGFEEDDPRRPFAALWGESGSAEFGTVAIKFATVGVGGVPVLIPGVGPTVPTFFEPTPAGDAALQTYIGAPTATAIAIPLTTGTVRVV